MTFPERFVQELSVGLLRRVEQKQALLPEFIRRLEMALPRDASWLRLEKAPWWESPESRRFYTGDEVRCIATMPPPPHPLIQARYPGRPTVPPERRNWVAAGCGDGKIHIWDMETRRLIATLEGHTGVVRAVSFSLDGTRLASGAGDNTVRVWCCVTGRCLAVFECPGPGLAVWWDKTVPGRLAFACVVGDHRGKFPLAFFFTLQGPKPPAPLGNPAQNR